jgi:glycosyltransferase involved in cell wall biosynthesis
MVILMVHNRYRQPGGEDESTLGEVELLRFHGHEVVEYTEHNDRISGMSGLRVAGRTLWSSETYGRVRELIRRTRPQVMHVQNFFPLISPSVYYAARAERVPVVQTLRNYRLICPGSLLLRDGKVCEKCVGKRLPYPSVLHGCYRGSRAATAVVAGMVSAHHALGTWTDAVDVYIALTEFSRRKFIAGGLPADRIVVKPNSVYPDPGVVEADRAYHLYAGRLSEEKGLMTLLQAWTSLRGVPLKVAGDGPLAPDAARFIKDNDLAGSVELLGRVGRAELLELLRGAISVVIPSICYETFGRSVVEAFACGTPVAASRIGALEENVEHEVNGLLFEPGNAADLARSIAALGEDSARLARMGQAARRTYESLFAAEPNYRLLVSIYGEALARRQRQARGGTAPVLRGVGVQ